MKTVIKKSSVQLIINFILLILLLIITEVGVKLIEHNWSFYMKLPHIASMVADFILMMLFVILIFSILLLILLDWITNQYELYNGKVVHISGFITKKKKYFLIDNLIDITYKQSFIGKALNYGSITLVKEAGKTVLRSIENPESILEKIISKSSLIETSDNESENINDLIKKGENSSIEFKSSLRWDRKTNSTNKSLEKVVMKTIVGFLNAGGGSLLIGVNDDGSIIGLKDDYASLPKKSSDGFGNHFTQLFNQYIGVEHSHLLDFSFANMDECEICVVTVKPAKEPIYLDYEDKSEFYMRAGNTTAILNVKEATSYINNHWNH